MNEKSSRAKDRVYVKCASSVRQVCVTGPSELLSSVTSAGGATSAARFLRCNALGSDGAGGLGFFRRLKLDREVRYDPTSIRPRSDLATMPAELCLAGPTSPNPQLS